MASSVPFSSLAALALVLVARATAAEPTPDVARKADALFEEAKVLLREGDWASACARFEESFALDPSPSTQVKIARCRTHEGRLLAAIDEYRRARALNRELSRDARRAEELEAAIREDLAALDAAVPRVTVDVRAPSETAIALSIDGREVPAPAGGVPLDPGQHELVARASGFRDARASFTLTRGEIKTVTLELLPLSPPASTSPGSAPPRIVVARVPERQGGGQRVVGAVTMGAGGVTLGVAGYFGLRTLSLVDDARPDCSTVTNECGPVGMARLERARDAQRTGLVLAGAGAALLATGAVLYLTAPRTASLHAVVTTEGVVGSLRGRF